MIQEGGYFINLGCFDGITNDPIVEYIEKYKLNGYFVDANFDTLISCKKNFIGDSFVFECLGIHPLSGNQIFYKPKNIPNLPDWFHQTGSFSKNEIQKICNKLSINLDFYEEQTIRCQRIDEFIYERKLCNLQVVNLDLEGLDRFVIKQFPFEYVKPKIFVLEINSDNMIDEETCEFLSSHGYSTDRKPITNWSLEFHLKV